LDREVELAVGTDQAVDVDGEEAAGVPAGDRHPSPAGGQGQHAHQHALGMCTFNICSSLPLRTTHISRVAILT